MIFRRERDGLESELGRWRDKAVYMEGFLENTGGGSRSSRRRGEDC